MSCEALATLATPLKVILWLFVGTLTGACILFVFLFLAWVFGEILGK